MEFQNRPFFAIHDAIAPLASGGGSVPAREERDGEEAANARTISAPPKSRICSRLRSNSIRPAACRRPSSTIDRSSPATRVHADCLHLLGVLAHQVGRNDLAVDLIGKALALNDRVPEFHYNIGLAHGALGQFEQAATHNRRAIALNPSHAKRISISATRSRPEGNRDEALASYRRAIAIRPSPEGHYNLANVLAELGRLR